MEIAADQEGLWVDDNMGGKGRFVPLAPKEFIGKDAPATRITFTKNEKGQITGLIFTGLGPTAINATKLP